MSTTLKKFVKGIILRGESADISETSEGSLFNNSTDQRLKAYIQGAIRQIVTNSQQQTLTNKSIDADQNTITNIDNADIKAGAAIDASKIADGTISNVEFQHLDGVSSNIQTQLTTSATAISTHTGASSNVHGIGSGNSVVGTGTSQALTNKTIDADLNTITNIDNADIKASAAIARNKLASGSANRVLVNDGTGVMSDAAAITASRALISDSNGIPTHSSITSVELGRLTGVTADIQPQLTAAGSHISASTDVHGIGSGNSVVGTGTSQALTNKTISSSALTGFIGEESQNNSQSGASVTLTSVTKPVVRLTNSSLTSVTGISALTSLTHGGVLTLINATPNEVSILNDIGTASERILTGTGDDIELSPDGALFLKYDIVSSLWRVIGGVGGSVTKVKLIAGENLSARDIVYQSSADGKVYKADNTNDNKVEVLGFVNKTVLANATADIVTSGVMKGFTGLTAGTLYYLNSTGGLTSTPSTVNETWNISVGLAISATQLVINPIPSSSAAYVIDSLFEINLLNNQSSSVDVSGLVFDPLQVRSFIVDYSIYREDNAQGKAQIGQLRGTYNSKTSTFYLSDDFAGENAGIEFSIQPSGQIQYSSSNFSNTSYSCVMKYAIRRTFTI